MLEFKNVSKTYQGDKPAVEGVTLTFNEGEFIVFIGTSGSGKTTCMRMINRMTEPTSGTILLNGRDIATMDHVTESASAADSALLKMMIYKYQIVENLNSKNGRHHY